MEGGAKGGTIVDVDDDDETKHSMEQRSESRRTGQKEPDGGRDQSEVGEDR